MESCSKNLSSWEANCAMSSLIAKIIFCIIFFFPFLLAKYTNSEFRKSPTYVIRYAMIVRLYCT